MKLQYPVQKKTHMLWKHHALPFIYYYGIEYIILHPTYLMAKENCITLCDQIDMGRYGLFRVFFYSHKLFNMYLSWQKLSFIYQFPCWLQLILIVSQMLFRLEPHETNIWTFSICLCLVWQIMFTVNQYFLVWELWQPRPKWSVQAV